MTRRNSFLTLSTLTGAFLLASWTVRGGDQKPAEDKPMPCAPALKSTGLDRIKALAGEWVLADKPNDPPYCTYRVVSGGTAVMEELMPVGEENMITMYHLDGNDVVLTHYCGLGNQPRMKAKVSDAKHMQFDFTGGCNIKPDGKYMSGLTMTFFDNDHFKASWTLTDKGKAGEHVTFDLVRKKKA